MSDGRKKEEDLRPEPQPESASELTEEELGKAAGGTTSLRTLEVEPVNFQPKSSLAGLEVEPVNFTPKLGDLTSKTGG